MNTIKRFNLGVVLLFTTFIFLSSNLFAQQRQEQGPPQIPNSTQTTKMVKEMSTELSLNKAQESEILKLFTNHFAEMGNKGGQRKSREEMESLKSKFEQQVKDLLTNEQKAKFDNFMKNHRPQTNQQNPKR